MRRIEIHRENGGGGERDRGGRGNGEEREREKWIKENKKKYRRNIFAILLYNLYVYYMYIYTHTYIYKRAHVWRAEVRDECVINVGGQVSSLNKKSELCDVSVINRPSNIITSPRYISLCNRYFTSLLSRID